MANELKIISTRRTVVNVTLYFYSEYANGRPADTRVMLDDVILLCWISYADIDAFAQSFENTINGYRI